MTDSGSSNGLEVYGLIADAVTATGVVIGLVAGAWRWRKRERYEVLAALPLPPNDPEPWLNLDIHLGAPADAQAAITRLRVLQPKGTAVSRFDQATVQAPRWAESIEGVWQRYGVQQRPSAPDFCTILMVDCTRTPLGTQKLLIEARIRTVTPKGVQKRVRTARVMV